MTLMTREGLFANNFLLLQRRTNGCEPNSSERRASGDSIRRNDGTVERRNGMAEHTEYSKIRNTRNILKHGKY